MARVTGGILGELSGKVGDVVFRKRNKKNFVSQRPETYNASSSPKAVSARAKFSVTVKFAKFINAIPVFSNLWKSNKIKGENCFSRLIKHNSNASASVHPTHFNKITPDGYWLPLTNLTYSIDRLTVTLGTFQKEFTALQLSELYLYAVLLVYDPAVENLAPFELIELSRCPIPSEYSNVFNAQIILDENEKELIKKYNWGIVYFAAVGIDTNTGNYEWTSTIPKDLILQ